MLLSFQRTKFCCHLKSFRVVSELGVDVLFFLEAFLNQPAECMYFVRRNLPVSRVWMCCVILVYAAHRLWPLLAIPQVGKTSGLNLENQIKVHCAHLFKLGLWLIGLGCCTHGEKVAGSTSMVDSDFIVRPFTTQNLCICAENTPSIYLQYRMSCFL